MKLVAKPDYAVASINARHAPVVHGLSVTFMKVVDGKLDPKDTYESDWIGGMGGGGPTKLGGSGAPVIGVAGKANKKDLTGLGLILQEPAKK